MPKPNGDEQRCRTNDVETSGGVFIPRKPEGIIKSFGASESKVKPLEGGSIVRVDHAQGVSEVKMFLARLLDVNDDIQCDQNTKEPKKLIGEDASIACLEERARLFEASLQEARYNFKKANGGAGETTKRSKNHRSHPRQKG